MEESVSAFSLEGDRGAVGDRRATDDGDIPPPFTKVFLVAIVWRDCLCMANFFCGLVGEVVDDDDDDDDDDDEEEEEDEEAAAD